MRILPRVPLYTAVAASATACLLVFVSNPASAQSSLQDWAETVGGDLDPIPCEVSDAPAGETLNGTPWHATASGLSQAHQHNTGLMENGEPVKVAVIDSGTTAEHPTFAGNVIEGADPYDPGAKGQCDLAGHGTWVAGIIAGGHDDSGYVGVAPDAEIMPFRLYPTGEEGGNNDDISRHIASTIAKAVDEGAQVINISIAVLPTDELEQAVAYAWNNDVLIVAATGNESKWMDETKNEIAPKDRVYYPANYEPVLAVGATNVEGGLYEKENFGPNLDLVAPGVEISAPAPNGEGYNHRLSGTSFAAPYVAGAAALLIGKFGPTATPAWITERLLSTATHPADGRNEFQGFGMLNIPKALTSTETEDDPVPGTGADVEPQQIQAFPADYDPLADEKTIAWASVGGAIVLITLVLVLKKLIPSGRSRGWRPGTRRPDDLPVKVEGETV